MARPVRASVFLDIDETLCHNGGEPSAQDLESLRQLKARGHRLFFCTARTLATLPGCLVDLEPDGVVSAAGSRVIAGNRILYDRYVPYGELRPLVAGLLDSGLPFGFETKEAFYTLNGYPFFAESATPLDGLAAFDALGPDVAVSKLSFPAKELFAREALQQRITRRFELIVYSSGYCEAILGDVSKGLGIRMIMEDMALPFAHSYAVGDNIHDLTMFNSVETGIAMGNADEALKRAADYVTDTVANSGVTKALRHFGLIGGDHLTH